MKKKKIKDLKKLITDLKSQLTDLKVEENEKAFLTIIFDKILTTKSVYPLFKKLAFPSQKVSNLFDMSWN